MRTIKLATLLLGCWVPLSGFGNSSVCEAENGSKCLYVTPMGTGDGQLATPGRLSQILPLLSQGDFLYLRGGEYTQTHFIDDHDVVLNLEKYFNFANPQPTADGPITIKGYPGETAVIKGDFSKTCVFIERHSHLIFENLTIRDCFNGGVSLVANGDSQNVTFRNMHIHNIQYNDNSGFISVLGYKSVVIEDSIFHDYLPKPVTDQVGFYLKFFRARDVIVRNNEFYGAGGGIYYKHGEASIGAGGFTQIHDNHFHNLSRTAIQLNQNRVEIMDNLIVGSGISVHHEDGTQALFTTGTVIAYNTIVDGGIVLNAGSNNGSYNGLFGLGAKQTSIHHNVLYNSDYSIWRYGSDEQYNDGIGLSAYKNCFYQNSGQQVFDFFSSDSRGALGDNYTLAEFQNEVGQDLNSLETAPQFINPVAGNFHLQEGTSCHNLGAGIRYGIQTRQEEVCFPIKGTQTDMTVICL